MDTFEQQFNQTQGRGGQRKTLREKKYIHWCKLSVKAC
jgi:hypothetical protein